MKTVKILSLLTALFICFFACVPSVSAAEIVTSKYENGRVHLSGTGEDQVQIVVFDSNNSPLYMTTAPVTNGSFDITLPEIVALQTGSFTVKVADYDGGNVKKAVIVIPTATPAPMPTPGPNNNGGAVNTGDASTLFVCCACLAVIASGALLILTSKKKTQKVQK